MKYVFSQTGLRWFWVAILVLIMDRVTKLAAQYYLIAYVPHPLTTFFNFTLAYNKGASFGFLNSATGWQMWLFGAIAFGVSVGILICLYRLSYQARWLSIALSFVMGGALGNLWDRISYGHVIDFIQVYAGQWYFPTFNIADSAICVGAGMLFLEAVVKRK
ncbi:MAG TPA: signal peptidase II [Gammaproteobacteria bacterium]|nr:signal peptidase II [Gammaproteobacteria bacterium]